jgi:thiol-disulfide isomerase/thioredoxin
MVYAEWCVHCKNMMPAFESAAKSSSVPFVRVTGPQTPVSCSKYAVAGYPTIFGVGSVLGSPRRFAGQRTADALHDFAKALGSSGTPGMASGTPGMASRLPEVEVYTPQVVPSQPLQSAQPSQPTQPTQIPIADTVDVSI